MVVRIPLLALTSFEPNISLIYTHQLQSSLSLVRSRPMKVEQIVSSETSALKVQTPGEYPKDLIQQDKWAVEKAA